MGTYVGKSRSNYFRVKDRAAFEQWCQRYDLELIERTDPTAPDQPLVGFTCDGDLPDAYDSGGEIVEESVEDTLAEHLAEGEIAVLMEVGSENLKYLLGYACAINWKGDIVMVDLGNIYDRLPEIGGDARTVTACEY